MTAPMKLYIHGNCQSTALRRMVDDLGSAIRVRSREVHALNIPDEIDAYVRDISEADVILTQPVGNDYRDEPRLSLSWIEANKRRDSVVVRFLPLYTRCYMPSQGYLASIDALAMPYHDYHIVDHYLRGTPVNSVLTDLDDPELYNRDFLDNELSLDFNEAKRRERENVVQIPLTDFIVEAYRYRLLFHTINHPSRLLLAIAQPALHPCWTCRQDTGNRPRLSREYSRFTVPKYCKNFRVSPRAVQ